MLKSRECSLVYLFNKSGEYIEKNFTKTASQRISKSNHKNEAAKKTKNADQSGVENENASAKKCSMKTAADVINRIQWDAAVNKEFITVGYVDRFLGLKECAFDTFDWGDIVLAELGSLAIPEHRISYFKYKNELVWDKSARLDNFFGSTGSNTTIHDVIKRLENQVFTRESEISDDNEEINRVGRANNKSTEPNYFVSVPVVDSEMKKNFAELKNDLVKANSNIESFIIPETSLHLTLCTLRIEKSEELEKLKQLLKDLGSCSEFSENFPVNIIFEGLCEFYNKVLYVNCLGDDLVKLGKVKNLILDKLKENEISTAGNYYEFHPHLTVFKIGNTKSGSATDTVRDLVSKDLWTKYANFKFGHMKIDELDLCKMCNIFSCQTYPVEFSLKVNN